MRKGTQILVLVIPLLCLPACSDQNEHELRSRNHDQILFERASIAVQQKQFSVANLNFQTLVNTYPQSEYAHRARQMLQDSPIARCGGGFSNSPVTLCNPDPAAAHGSELSPP
jgi:outer membrane protein assembly factor BamD (BamD/ComL family)